MSKDNAAPKEQKIKYGYGVTSDNVDVAETTKVALPPGIHEDVTFVNAEFSSLTDTGDKYLMMNYEKDGKTVRDLIFELDNDRLVDNYEKYPPNPHKRGLKKIGLEKGDIPTLDQYMYLKYQAFNDRIKHFLGAFIKDDEDANFGDVDSYKDLAEKVIELVTPYFGSLVRLKVVYNKDDYSSLPKFGTWIEQGVEQSASKMTMGKNDKDVKSGNGAAPIGAPMTATSPGMPAAPTSAPVMAAPMAPPPTPPKS